ncbi:lipopolysaccharide assembly protein LapA domain-containing protein [Acaryochloris sp. CCMEE 5410]|uniref:lipopolysaccharide assembly protein LapA domain-containing protein n=1 Tax=Acaryochloris sp. CCMEE 5410 TaxID=310037 RepID=UPI000248533D|nr:LapA family protein [Acaryochloris sp. CCMEE 5410]KAI9133788.1 LapA family protein [Acaryochloris sp. CCMEE 5410]
MRQVNFTLIFVICLAVVLFAIENTQLVSIKVVNGVQLTAPLSIELIITLGIGAVLAWVFSVWTTVQELFVTREALQAREVEIESLQSDLERYKAELEEQRLLLPSQATVTSDAVSVATLSEPTAKTVIPRSEPESAILTPPPSELVPD